MRTQIHSSLIVNNAEPEFLKANADNIKRARQEAGAFLIEGTPEELMAKMANLTAMSLAHYIVSMDSTKDILTERNRLLADYPKYNQ